MASPSLQIVSVIGANGQPLPLTGTSLGSTWAAPVKQERADEAEIQELAAKIVEQQKATFLKQQQQAAQLANRPGAAAALPSGVGGQANIMNYLTRPNNANAKFNGAHGAQVNLKSSNGAADNNTDSLSSDKKPCDEESQKGHFGWTTFGKIYIPYINRQAEKYVAVRMTEQKLLGKYLNCLHPDIYSSCTCVRSYYITEAESRLLNEVNHKHCDAQFGRDLFTLKDVVVRLSDATKFYQFLDICYKKLMSGNKSPSEKCGFIRINKESVVPYTVRNNEQVVPLFYFEGETENLKQKADNLSGWDLAYLKFCCKVQGIRNELFSSESVAVISLTDIKSYFPNGTEFEDYWPSKVVDTNLLLAQRSSGNSINWTRQPSAPPPKMLPAPAAKVTQQHQQQQQTKRSANYTFPNAVPQSQAAAQRIQTALAAAGQLNQSAAAVQALNGWSQQFSQAQGSIAPILLAQAQASQNQQNQRGYTMSRNQMANMMAANRQYTNYTNGTMSMQALNCPTGQQPPPLVRSASQNQQNQMLQQAVLQQHQHAQQQQQQQRLNQMQSRSNSVANSQQNTNSATMHLQRHAAAASAAQQSSNGLNRLCIIPEVPTGSVNVQPYKVQKVFVDNHMVPCINMKAYHDDEQLMTLTDFREYFFPNIPLETCKRFIDAISVEMYKGNRRQIQILMENGRATNENIPLIQVRDIIKYMPQLRFMMRNNQEQPPSKRTRVS